MKTFILILLFALTCACGPVKETDTTAYVRLTKTCDSLKLAHNTLAYQVAENRYYDSMLIEKMAFDIEAHRRVIKMHGKAIKIVATRQLKADSLEGKDSKFYRTMDKIGYGASVLRKALIGI